MPTCVYRSVVPSGPNLQQVTHIFPSVAYKSHKRTVVHNGAQRLIKSLRTKYFHLLLLLLVSWSLLKLLLLLL